MTLAVDDMTGTPQQIENDCVGGPEVDDTAAAIDATGIDSTSDETLVGRSKGQTIMTFGFNAAPNHSHAVFSQGKGIARTLTIHYKDATAAIVATYGGEFLHLGYRVNRAANGAITCPVTMVNAPASTGAWS